MIFRAFSAAIFALAMAHMACAQTPPTLWQFNYPYPYSPDDPPWLVGPPALGYDGTIYIRCTRGYLFAINPDGTLKWRFVAGGNLRTPAIGVDGTIYFSSAQNGLYAVTPGGTLKWKFQTTNYIYCSPAIGSDGTIYIASTDGKFYALYPDGTKKWDYFIGQGLGNASPAIGKDGNIYIGSASQFYAFTPGGSNAWQYPAGQTGAAAAIDTNGVIYFTGDGPGRRLTSLYPNGTLNWQYSIGSSVGSESPQSAPAIGADGSIFVSHYGNVFSVRPDGSPAWTLGGGDTYCSPTVRSDGTILAGDGRYHFSSIRADGSFQWQFSLPDLSDPLVVQYGATVGSDGTIYFASARTLYALAGGQPPADSPWPTFQKTSTHTGRYDLESTGPPVINLQPVSQTAILNSSTYFYASAGGTLPLSFQWYKDTNAVSGATNSILRLQSVTLADTATYTLVVTNSLGATNTVPAALSVIPGMQLDIYAGITIQGQVGATCQIQYCYDLSNTNNWTPLTNFTLPTATYFWIDPTPARSQSRFYRAFLSP